MFISLMSVVALILSFLMLIMIFQVKNSLIRSISLVTFIIFIPVVFGNFLTLTGEPRKMAWDILWVPPDKMEILSFQAGQNVLFLWLRRPDGTPIYYVMDDPKGEKKKKLREEVKTAKEKNGKVYYRFRKQGPKEEESEKKHEVTDALENSNLSNEFFSSYPTGNQEPKTDDTHDTLIIDRTSQ